VTTKHLSDGANVQPSWMLANDAPGDRPTGAWLQRVRLRDSGVEMPSAVGGGFGELPVGDVVLKGRWLSQSAASVPRQQAVPARLRSTAATGD
jgi:hypothetical protein